MNSTNDDCNLILVKSVCTNCFSKLFDNTDQLNECGDDFQSNEENIEKLDAACSLLGISPASKIRKLSSEKRSIALQNKVERVPLKLKRNLETAFEENISEASKIPITNELLEKFISTGTDLF